MKKVLPLTLISLFLLSVAHAENVSHWEYTLTIRDLSLPGYYTGEIVDGEPDGYGIFETLSPNGPACHYVGQWRNGIMHGRGAIYGMMAPSK